MFITSWTGDLSKPVKIIIMQTVALFGYVDRVQRSVYQRQWLAVPRCDRPCSHTGPAGGQRWCRQTGRRTNQSNRSCSGRSAWSVVLYYLLLTYLLTSLFWLGVYIQNGPIMYSSFPKMYTVKCVRKIVEIYSVMVGKLHNVVSCCMSSFRHCCPCVYISLVTESLLHCIHCYLMLFRRNLCLHLK